MYLDKFKLDGRVALITGGNRGLGFEMARALAEAGETRAIVKPAFPGLFEKGRGTMSPRTYRRVTDRRAPV